MAFAMKFLRFVGELTIEEYLFPTESVHPPIPNRTGTEPLELIVLAQRSESKLNIVRFLSVRQLQMLLTVFDVCPRVKLLHHQADWIQSSKRVDNMRAQFVVDMLRNELCIVLPIESPVSDMADNFIVTGALLQAIKFLQLFILIILIVFERGNLFQCVDIYQLLIRRSISERLRIFRIIVHWERIGSIFILEDWALWSPVINCFRRFHSLVFRGNN